MTPVEFDLALNKLQAEFPKGQAYSEGRRKLIYQAVNHLPQFNFERIVKHFILSAKHLPTPREIIDAAKREGIKENIYEAGTERQPVSCEWCCDGGVMEVVLPQAKKELFIRCDCVFGQNSFRTELPIWTNQMRHDLERINMAKEGFKKWKPKVFDPKNPIDSIQDKVEMWKIKMKVSVAFWEDLIGKDPNDAA